MLEKDPARRLPDMHQFVSRAEALLAELIAAES
jgi:hypothetical protein